jgi:aspartyl-tRNA(Asn)/glutamyl-tRNA(Gln) amidotransferase subunit C
MVGKLTAKKGEKELLSREEVLHIAGLAKLNLTETEVKLYQRQLSEVLIYVGQLKHIETKSVPETSQVTGLVNIVRPDEINSSQRLTKEAAQINAPEKENGYFKVKAILRAK